MEQDGVVGLHQCRAAGLSLSQVKRLCRSRTWQRVTRGAYLVDADIRGGPDRAAIIRASMLSCGSQAVAVLQTAAEIHGFQGLADRPQVHVSLPGPLSRPARLIDREITFHQLVLRPGEIQSVRGMRVTSPVRTAADLLLQLDRYSAVCLLDSGLNRELLAAGDLDLLLALTAGRRGVERAREWLAEVDGRAASPLETRIRLRCVDGHVAPDELQFPVYDAAGQILGVGDLAWKRHRLIAEGDGAAVHSGPEALFRDRWRQNDLVNAGYRLVRFTWGDTLKPAYIPNVIRRAIATSAS